jgi:hypothetical protein
MPPKVSPWISCLFQAFENGSDRYAIRTEIILVKFAPIERQRYRSTRACANCIGRGYRLGVRIAIRVHENSLETSFLTLLQRPMFPIPVHHDLCQSPGERAN